VKICGDPGFEIGELDMNQGQANTSVLRICQDGGLMHEILAGLDVADPAVSEQIGARRQAGLEEGAQVLGGGRVCHGNLCVAGHKAAVVDPLGLLALGRFPLQGHDDQAFVVILHASAATVRAALAAVVGFIGLHHTGEELVLLFEQGPSELVQHGPCRGVAQVELPGLLHGRDAPLVLDQQLGSPEPHQQGQLGTVQDGAGGHRLLVVADRRAHEHPGTHSELIGLLASALAATVPLGPPQKGQILYASLLCS